jgi:hypothetical protein
MSVTIEYLEVEFEVNYDYQPGEPEVRYYSDGSGYPGCPESCDITEVNYGKRDMFEYFDDQDFEKIEQLLWDEINDSYRGYDGDY